MSFTFVSENDKFGAVAGPDAPTPPSTGAQYRKHFRWGENYVPPEKQPALDARSTASIVVISNLKINAEQHKLIEAMYYPASDASFSAPQIIDHIFPITDAAQLQASGIMAQHGLDADSRKRIDISQKLTRSQAVAGPNSGAAARCGYDHSQRNTEYDRTQNIDAPPGTQKRHTPLPFTACLAHVEITVRSDTVLRIRGHFDHNQGCRAALDSPTRKRKRRVSFTSSASPTASLQSPPHKRTKAADLAPSPEKSHRQE
ncbi:hypothetical protein B0H17DRAFT_1103804 [Mycena rosella]|uniref:Uncharacterized protein n=1 Tax=Mycena rosella TaxID=1033263 RepID=A0AAD7CD83_MYCRO|nr:hypothetical protein B0H17DRAFT_1103804 [Mycena rosella]